MKFTEMPYSRPSADELIAIGEKTLEKFNAATTAAEQYEAMQEFEKASGTFDTLSTLAYVRHTIDTRDEFYDAEIEYIDEVSPRVGEIINKLNKAMLASEFRAELEQMLGKLVFVNLEISARTFAPENIELMQQENKLVSEYQKLYASAIVEFNGEKMPLPKLGPFKESPDRAVRRAAYETEGKFFDDNREELDRLYDELIKVRTQIARNLGHENFTQLGYDRLGRNCYDAAKVAAFREQIANDLVPIVARVKEDQRKRLGLDSLKFYDDPLLFPDGNAKPIGTADEILAAGKEMYHALSEETAEFIDFMFDNELFDVLSKDGKAPGGYCTEFYDYKSPFIFSNFNGTSGDVDVLTHEAGHAFAGYRALKMGYIRDLLNPTMEACECHSMSMEFLTSEFHKNFFGDATRKYEICHCEDALIFIPYGCMVDEFQHIVYANPELTPEQRNEEWLKLEKKYRPWIDFDNLPFYSRGAGWQRQLHIFELPFYYIDYCIAQTIAFQFWMAYLKDKQDAWKRYLAFVDKGGTVTFEELVHSAGLKLPYDDGCIKEIGDGISAWIDSNPL